MESMINFLKQDANYVNTNQDKIYALNVKGKLRY